MQDTDSSAPLDHSSAPNFLAFYLSKGVAPASVEHFSRIRDKALALLRQQMPGRTSFKMLDVGCNPGAQARLWAELGHEVTGLDINEPLLEAARARAQVEGLNIDFKLGTATQLPFEDASMDVCILLELLEHVSDWQACLNEAVRVVKPGGLLYLSTTNVLCPKQQEFDLPIYSWYPGPLKRRFKKLSVTTRPELVNYARYPALHWFTFYGLRDYLASFNMSSLDRFDLIDTRSVGGVGKATVWAVRHIPPLRFVGHVMTDGTALMAIKGTEGGKA